MNAETFFNNGFGEDCEKVHKNHVVQLMQNFAEHYHTKQLRLYHVSKSLPIKKYEIDFGGNVLAGLEITNNEPTVIGAMNGWGNGISKDDITITEK